MARTKGFFSGTSSYTLEEINNMIAKKAYELWQKRGCPAGSDKKDWYEAERIVKSDLRNM